MAVLYKDRAKDFGSIGTFVVYEELRSILSKVIEQKEDKLSNIVSSRGAYKYDELVKSVLDNSKIKLLKKTNFMIQTSALDVFHNILFFKKEPKDDKKYMKVLGRFENKREFHYIREDYVKTPKSHEMFKVILPKSNGSGAIGEVLSTPLIGEPLIGYTETFISIGAFDKRKEAENLMKYVKSKFARAMLGTLKITQDNTSEKWANVPIQDFTENSDIDWSKSIKEIDRQLYKKYGLSENEINFIEEKVREMK